MPHRNQLEYNTSTLSKSPSEDLQGKSTAYAGNLPGSVEPPALPSSPSERRKEIDNEVRKSTNPHISVRKKDLKLRTCEGQSGAGKRGEINASFKKVDKKNPESSFKQV